MAKESEKLDIEDIKDPLDELDKDKEVDLEDAVAEEADPSPAPKKDEPVPEDTPKEEKVEEESPKEPEKETETEPPTEEPKEAEDPKKEKPKKVKKPFPWKTVLIVLITFLITAALIMGGLYLYEKKRAPKEEPKTEDTTAPEEEAEEKPVVTQKTVYVTVAEGLNLRKEPSSTSEKLTVIPFGTKLEVLATQGTWYKTTYNSLTGWVDSTYTGTTSPLIYKNTKYGFEVTLPATWSAYKVFEGKDTEVAIFYFALPTSDKKWTDPSDQAGYGSLFAASVYTKAQYDAAKAEGGPIGDPIATKGDYVLLASPGQATPSDLNARYAEVNSILKTLKFY